MDFAWSTPDLKSRGLYAYTNPNRSCKDFTLTSLPCSAVHAATAAWAAAIVVMHVTPRPTAAERILRSSDRLTRPLGVLMISATWPFCSRSSRFGRPVLILLISRHFTPAACSIFSVPDV